MLFRVGSVWNLPSQLIHNDEFKNVPLSIPAVFLTSCTLILHHTINTEAQSISEICPIGTLTSDGSVCMCRCHIYDAPACQKVHACAYVRTSTWQ